MGGKGVSVVTEISSGQMPVRTQTICAAESAPIITPSNIIKNESSTRRLNGQNMNPSTTTSETWPQATLANNISQPDTNVNETSLNDNTSKIKRALHDCRMHPYRAPQL